jgi:hypothetical protein
VEGDAERAANDAGYTKLCELRDTTLAELAASVQETRRQIESLAATGNRSVRRKVRGALSKLARYETIYRRRVEATFDRMANGYDADAGTFAEVQSEVASKLSAIFG